MSEILEDLLHFLNNSPTSLHAANEIGNRFASYDFLPLAEEEKWDLLPKGNYFVQREGSICAFSLPESKPKRSIILASHTDSPALKLKPHPENVKKNAVYLSTEVYGGPILHSWLNRDLAIAGKIVYSTQEGSLEEKLIFLDDSPIFIPELAIHLQRDMNEKGIIVNKQEHLCPLAALYEDAEGHKDYLESLLRKHIPFNKLLGFDLFLVPLEAPRKVGPEGEMLASYRLDNLSSAHSCVNALLHSEYHSDKQTIQMALFCDHEEIGSSTRQSPTSFLKDTLQRIFLSLGCPEEQYLQSKKHSLCLSIDVAHGFHPSYSDKYDPNHAPMLGKGIVLKSSANQRYANDALSSSQIMQLCQKHGLPYQSYVNRSDIPGGSTLGPLIAEHTGIRTADIGIPLLSMHSCREIIGCRDHVMMCLLLKHIFEEADSYVLS